MNTTTQIDPVIYSADIMANLGESDEFDISASLFTPSDFENYSTSSSTPGSMSSFNFPVAGGSAALAYAGAGVSGQSNEEIDFRINLSDDDLREMETPSPTTILFFEIMQDFPDLSSFVCHPDFISFSRIWLEYQRHIYLAQDPKHRAIVQAWLKTAALQLHFFLITLVRSSPDRNQEAACMFSAFRRLKDRVELMHSVIDIVESGRQVGQTPLEAINPLVNQADEIERNVDYFTQEQNVIPVVDPHTNLVELKDPGQVSLSELSNGIVSTYNMMPYNNNNNNTNINNNTMSNNDQSAFALDAAMIPNIAGIPTADHWDFQAPFVTDNTIVSNNKLTSFQPVHDFTQFASGASTTPTFYVPAHDASVNRFGFETPLTQSSSTSTPVLFSHIEPSWIHSPQVNWSSLPVTPSAEHSSLKFLSHLYSPPCYYPGVPAAKEELEAIQEPVQNETIQTPCHAYGCDTLTAVSPTNTCSEQDGDGEYDGDEECQTPSTQDDDYSQLSDMDDDDDDWIEPCAIKQQQQQQQQQQPSAATITTAATNRRGRKTAPYTKELRKREAVSSIPKARRTATSYDSKTTHYLKSVFFDIYSSKDKLSKDQRRKVQQETGLKPRNITYWFSNHKRRFQHALNVFKQTVQDTQGKVKTYDDFLLYRRVNGLPEEVQDGEFLDAKNSSL